MKRKHKADSSHKQHVEDTGTYLVPFVVLACLSLPSLLVMAYSKQTAGFDLLEITGLFTVMMAIMWVLVPLAVAMTVFQILRRHDRLPKVTMTIVSVVLIASFVYVLSPK